MGLHVHPNFGICMSQLLAYHAWHRTYKEVMRVGIWNVKLGLVCLRCFRSSCLHYRKNYRGYEKGLPLPAWYWMCTLTNRYLDGSHSSGFKTRAKRQNCNWFWLFSTLHRKKVLMLGLFSHMAFSYTWLLSSAHPCEVILFVSYWFGAQRFSVSCSRLHSPRI